MNKYPLWKNLLLMFILVVAVIYASPVFFGETPAVQVSSVTAGQTLTQNDLTQVKSALKAKKIVYESAIIADKNVLIKLKDADTQLKAKETLKTALGEQYIVALSLVHNTPAWLQSIGAIPMKLGLDLRGGVHFLMQIDTDSVIKQREAGYMRSISQELRDKRIRYAAIAQLRNGGVSIKFRDNVTMGKAKSLLQRQFPDFVWDSTHQGGIYKIDGALLDTALLKIEQYAIEQTMTTLRRRVNELGVSEAIVQQQGKDRISVDLPGIQDAAQAKDILGKTATLEFHMVDTKHEAADIVGGMVPAGDELLNSNDGMPVLLKNRVVLSGDSITNANASYDQSGRPNVSITLGGGGESIFERITAENIGNPMATVYVETKSKKVKDSKTGKEKIVYKQIRKVINVATIQSALGMNFQITGLSSPLEAKNLALLLRAGSLPAAITIVEERTVGPSMGKQNIHMGMMSVFVGTGLVIIFMIFYYRLFGLIADFGLLVNLTFLIAVLSAIGATLTFAGIAGIVLTMGMAIDANVLIYERIREELRNGMTPQAAIHAGYARAFVTIVDANVTTLIVAMILFALGSGSVKGFAITLTIGLLTSMLTAITYTRMVVNFIYGGRRVKHLSIGIKVKDK
jgi:preprotein translocase subunit SecD